MDWQASDGNTTHSSSQDEFMNAFQKIKDRNKSKLEEEYERLLNSPFGQSPAPPLSTGEKHWPSLQAMLADLATQKIPAVPVDRASRRREIEAELDIIRGRVPTPRGYVINPIRAKKLMLELKQLSI